MQSTMGCKVKETKKTEHDGVFCWRDFYKLFFHPMEDSLTHWPTSPPDYRREAETIIKCFDDLPGGVVAMILAMLPTFDIYHGRSVCKAWDSIIRTDLSFRCVFNESVHRRPWFLLLDTKSSSSQLRPKAVFNMEAVSTGAWCQVKLKIPVPTSRTTTARANNVVISSGGLLCLWSGSDNLIVCNPLIDSSHHLPLLSPSDGGHYFKGMTMHVLPYSESTGRLSYQVFILIAKKVDRTRVLQIKTYASSLTKQRHGVWKEILQVTLNTFETGRIAGVTTVGQEGQILLHFISGDGSKVICCDIQSGTIYMTPEILPLHQYCKDSELVVCDGTLFAVILSGDVQQPLAPSQLQIYEYPDDTHRNTKKEWKHVTTMPGTLPEKYCHNGKDHDHAISCAGYGDYILVYVTCASSKLTPRSSYAVMFNNKEGVWVLLDNPPHTGLTPKLEIHALMPDID